MPENHDPFENLTAPIAAPTLAATPEHQSALRAAQLPSAAELIAGEVCSAPEATSILPPTPTPMPTPSEVAASRQHHVRANGKANPYKPTTPDEIAIFVRQWRDPAYTLDMMGRRYHCHARTIQKWSEGFGLGPRDDAGHANIAGSIDQVAAMLKDTAAMESALARTPQVSDTLAQSEAQADVRFNPLADPEIKAALDDIQREALAMTAHSDLTSIQRKLSRLSLILAAKAPAHSWPSLQDAMETMGRVFLYARKVEARLPETGADPVVLRKEAASQMMHELKSVLNPEEQAVLARVMKAGVDRLMKGDRRREPAS